MSDRATSNVAAEQSPSRELELWVFRSDAEGHRTYRVYKMPEGCCKIMVDLERVYHSSSDVWGVHSGGGRTIDAKFSHESDDDFMG